METLKGIWVFNDYPNLNSDVTWFFEFTSNGTKYYGIAQSYDYLGYVYMVGEDPIAVNNAGAWTNTAYKTIEITSEPTDEAFITWLTANATQQATEETSGVTVEYNGAVVATIPSGNKATIPIANKKMKTDIVITVPEAESGTDSAIPIAVSTEAEMTALLTSGEVGGVYKYTGTTGTYENGALYVLEATAGVTVKILGWYQTGFGYYSVNGGEDVQIADENYVVNATITKELADSACITLTNVTSLICKMTSMDVTFVNIKDSNFNDVEAELYGDWNDNYQQVLDVTSYLTEGCYVILYTDD